MQTLQELGEAIATRRRTLGLKQQDVARQAGITPETLSRFERGRLPELGARKLLLLLGVLGVLGLELDFIPQAPPPTLDDLRDERSQARGG